MLELLWLSDAYNRDSEPLKTCVKTDLDCVTIRFEGYDNVHDETVILVENRDGVPHVIVWGNVLNDDPTHVISLKGANIKHRKRLCPPLGGDI